MGDFLNRLRFYQYLLTDDMKKKARSDYNKFQDLMSTLAPHVGTIKGRTVLDVGCGRRYPLSLLLGSFGNTVTGIDIVYVGLGDSVLERYIKGWRCNGVESLMRSLAYDLLLKDRAYYRALETLCDFPLTTGNIKITQMGAESMVLPDEGFDIAVSNAVFEHIADVPKAVAELARVVRRGGYVHIFIHLFSALSGGHHPDYLSPAKVPPWDHLRERKHVVPSYLNGLREGEYIALFRDKFDIIELVDVGKGEGRDLLTPEIRAELADYFEEELLKRGITIVAQRRRL